MIRLTSFALAEADYKEFARFAAFYRGDPWFRAGYAALFDLFCPSSPCWWVMNGTVRVGGAVLAEGLLSHVFLIPPFVDRASLVRALTAHVKGISHGRIFAHGVEMDELTDYLAAGFRLAAELRGQGGEQPEYSYGFMRAMARPAQAMNVTMPEGLTAHALRLMDVNRAAELLVRAYAGRDPMRSDEKQFKEDLKLAVRGADNICKEASCVVERGGAPVGVAAITRWEGMALLFDIAVDPDCEGQGIAQYMLARALYALDRHGEPALRLFVEQGNTAESLYRRMGFIGGKVTTSLYMDVVNIH